MEALLTTRRFTVEEYRRIGECGVLVDAERLELIDGQIVVREPVGTRHAGTVDRLNRLWTSRLGDRVIVRVQNPVTFPEHDTELQPDVMLLRPQADFYAANHPRAADVLLLIEVADSTLRLDRRVKIPLYAQAGIREVWLVDLTADRVEVHGAPENDRYCQVTLVGRGQPLAPTVFPELTLTVDDVIG